MPIPPRSQKPHAVLRLSRSFVSEPALSLACDVFTFPKATSSQEAFQFSSTKTLARALISSFLREPIVNSCSSVSFNCFSDSGFVQYLLRSIQLMLQFLQPAFQLFFSLSYFSGISAYSSFASKGSLFLIRLNLIAPPIRRSFSSFCTVPIERSTEARRPHKTRGPLAFLQALAVIQYLPERLRLNSQVGTPLP